MALGRTTSTVRTPFQTETAKFWQLDTPTAMWDRVAGFEAHSCKSGRKQIPTEISESPNAVS